MTSNLICTSLWLLLSLTTFGVHLASAKGGRIIFEKDPDISERTGRRTCRNLDKSEGVCMSVERCPHKAQLYALKFKICSWNKYTPVVCCPSVDTSENEIPDEKQEETTIKEETLTEEPTTEVTTTDDESSPSTDENSTSDTPQTPSNSEVNVLDIGTDDLKRGRALSPEEEYFSNSLVRT